jgi:hypothetical protein
MKESFIFLSELARVPTLDVSELASASAYMQIGFSYNILSCFPKCISIVAISKAVVVVDYLILEL